MKRLIMAAVCFVLLCGCASRPARTQEPTPEAPPEQVEPETLSVEECVQKIQSAAESVWNQNQDITVDENSVILRVWSVDMSAGIDSASLGNENVKKEWYNTLAEIEQLSVKMQNVFVENGINSKDVIIKAVSPSDHEKEFFVVKNGQTILDPVSEIDLTDETKRLKQTIKNTISAVYPSAEISAIRERGRTYVHIVTDFQKSEKPENWEQVKESAVTAFVEAMLNENDTMWIESQDFSILATIGDLGVVYDVYK